MKAFYFSNKEKKLRYGDNRVIVVGRKHKVRGIPVLCKHGLHGSVKVLDALQYALSSNLYLIELGGDIATGVDKCCATERTYLKTFNAEKVLEVFARKQALLNIEKIKPYCSGDDYDLIVKYLETGDEGLKWNARAAADSAADSARAAAWSEAWSEARAAESAARAAAWTVAVESAVSAARSVVGSAVGSAAESAALSAARSAAWSEARSAALSAANTMLTEMIKEATGWEVC